MTEKAITEKIVEDEFPSFNFTHETVKINKKIVVDKNIAPVIKWLNTFDHVHTIFSCEGNRVRWSPYVLFISTSIHSDSEKKIRSVVMDFCKEHKLKIVDGNYKKIRKNHDVLMEVNAFMAWLNNVEKELVVKKDNFDGEEIESYYIKSNKANIIYRRFELRFKTKQYLYLFNQFLKDYHRIF